MAMCILRKQTLTFINSERTPRHVQEESNKAEGANQVEF